MESIPLRKKILETIVSKSTLKQKVFDNTFATFRRFKKYHPERYGVYIDSGEISLLEARKVS